MFLIKVYIEDCRNDDKYWYFISFSFVAQLYLVIALVLKVCVGKAWVLMDNLISPFVSMGC